MSLLSWERGLKSIIKVDNINILCRSSRGSVDWNPKTSPRWLQRMVAPLVGAWIEINVSSNIIKPLESLLSWERGLKSSYIRNINIRNCRSSRGSVDWNIHISYIYISNTCRSSRGSVDWNYKEVPQYELSYTVAPLVGAWIEIFW